MDTSMHMAIQSQTNHLLIPFIESSGEQSFKRLRNTILGTLSQSMGIACPAIIKELRIQSNNNEEQIEYESYRERCYAILNQLQPITPDNGITVFGTELKHTYEPLLVRGASKNQVLFVVHVCIELLPLRGCIRLPAICRSCSLALRHLDYVLWLVDIAC